MGKILGIKIKDKPYNIIKHNASTERGFSGSPIIKRSELNDKIIGLHFGSVPNKKNLNEVEDNAIINVANFFDLILYDIIKQIKIKYPQSNCSTINISENCEIGNNNNTVCASGIKKSEFSTYNNIIYFNEDNTNRDLLYKESNDFEDETNGAFILSTNLQSLNLIREEILMKNKTDNKIIFNLILGDINSKFDYFLSIYKDFQNICIYSKKTNYNLNDFQPKVYGYSNYNNKEDIIEFIKRSSSENIKPFDIKKVKTYNDYIINYREMHSKISSFYNNLALNLYLQNYKKIKDLINEE